MEWENPACGEENGIKRPLLVINHWEKNQCEEEEEEEAPMSIFQLAADYYCGDLCFV